MGSFAPWLVLGLFGCGGAAVPTRPNPTPVAYAPEFSALRWVPDKPTYVVAARTVADAQRAMHDVVDSLGMGFVSADEVSHGFERMLAVDPMSVEGAAALGADPAGGIAMFSTAFDPTFVVHLNAPATAQAFFDHLRDTGLATRSIIVNGDDVNSAKLPGGVVVSWAIDKDWLWVHFAFAVIKEPPLAWFTERRSLTGQPATWPAQFGWAKAIGDKLASHAPGVVGFVDYRALSTQIFGNKPAQALACAKLFAPISRIGIAVEGDGHHVGGRLELELGNPAQTIANNILPPPAGFAALADKAPIAAQWNLDLGAVASWFAPCSDTFGIPIAALTQFGVRGGRIALETLVPDDKSGTGVIALDLSSSTYFAQLLDQVPKRSLFESNRTFGTHAGHRLSIPFVITLDYILDQRYGIAAIGDGLMDKLVTGGSAPTAPLFALDVRPLALPAQTWQWMIAQLTGERYGKAVTERLMRWHDGHIAVTIDHGALVIDANGNRR